VAEEKIERSWESGSSHASLGSKRSSAALESMTHAECLAMIRVAAQQINDDEGTN
jgi:hypothetical protein